MLSEYLIFATTIIVAFVIIECSSWYLLHRLKIVPESEFPKVSDELLEKFNSFDPALGWEPVSGSTKKKDTGHNNIDDDTADAVVYSIDEFGSRVCGLDRDIGNYQVSTYGDSYCFCREVNNTETFQHYLSKDLGVHVSNYGVGNYGFDQAYLRMQRRFDDDPGDYVVMSVTSASIARILSVWKHYHEFGNILAAKPRYELSSGELDKIECPVDSKTGLQNMQKKKDYLREHDYHYENWFKKHQLYWPYTFRFLRHRDNIRYAVFSIINHIQKITGYNIPLNVDKHLNQARIKRDKRLVEYHLDLFEQFDDLYIQLVGKFVEFAESRGTVPIFMPLQQLPYARHEQQHELIDKNFINDIQNKYPELLVYDPREELQSNVENIEDLYVKRGEGGHHSPEANKLIAEGLGDIIMSHQYEIPQTK